MRLDNLVCGAALLMAGAPAFAQSSPVARAVAAASVVRPSMDARISATILVPRALIEQDYRRGLVQLRKTALKQKAADGGALAPESIASLQAKLDRLNMVRQRDLQILERS